MLRNAILVMLCMVGAMSARGEIKFDEGRWRLELTGASGVHQGSRDRSGDESASLTVEYEFPAARRLTLGLRVTPLFMYDDPDHTVWGAGAGLTLRVYRVKDEYRGLYCELEESVLVHHHRISGNSSNLNFQTGAGIGYQFRNNWHVVVRYAHISNASLGKRNAGANSIGVGLGFTF